VGWSRLAGVNFMMGPDELGRLLDEHAAALVLYARQWCSAPEDVVQEALVKLVSQRFPPRQPVAWLYKVVRNLAVSAARSARRRQRHESQAAERSATWFLPTDGKALDSAAATTALESLPEVQREVPVAHLWGGLTFEQVADLMGTSSSTAHRWYLAALSALRERLGVPCPKKSTTPN
jgi:RNA polymerase sigma-70 factor (ECF subfamily)